MTPLDDAAAARLLAAIDACDPTYDEVLLEVSERIASAKSAGKLDLAALINWKQGGQGKWAKSLLATAETDVRASHAGHSEPKEACRSFACSVNWTASAPTGQWRPFS